MQFKVTIPVAKGDDYQMGVIAETSDEAKRIAFESFKNLPLVKKGNIIVELVEQQPKALVVIDGIFPESLPDDFRTNDSYLNAVDEFITKTSGLVPEDSDEGEKQVKELANKINKAEKDLLSFVKQVFEAETAEVTEWSKSATLRIKALGTLRKSILEIFEQRKKERLASIKTLLIESLTELYDEHKIPDELRKMDISSLVLMSSMTPGGQLTKKAKDALNVKLYDAIRVQQLITTRIQTIQIKCLEEGINPPLTREHLGHDFLADEDLFATRLTGLIKIELARKQRAEEIEAKKPAQQIPSRDIPIPPSVVKQEQSPVLTAQEKSPPQPKLQVGEVALMATFKASLPNHFTDEQLLVFFTKRLNGIMEKAKQSGLLDENEKRFLTTLEKLEVYRA